jgi:hypothetical protein
LIIEVEVEGFDLRFCNGTIIVAFEKKLKLGFGSIVGVCKGTIIFM